MKVRSRTEKTRIINKALSSLSLLHQLAFTASLSPSLSLRTFSAVVTGRNRRRYIHLQIQYRYRYRYRYRYIQVCIEREVRSFWMGTSGQGLSNYDLSFKILLTGDSAVGKSSLLVTFISNSVDDLAPTIGVDFKIKFLTVGGKRLKLTIWDTAGQERFRTLTSSYYRGAQGIFLVYDVTRRATFTNLSDVWAKELELYSTNQECVKILVGNKVDRDSDRVVSREEGLALAEELGCLFLECSAKTRQNVEQCFEELALKIMEVPRLIEVGSTVLKRNILKQKPETHTSPGGGCCS